LPGSKLVERYYRTGSSVIDPASDARTERTVNNRQGSIGVQVSRRLTPRDRCLFSRPRTLPLSFGAVTRWLMIFNRAAQI
jgi:hypothetical protein